MMKRRRKEQPLSDVFDREVREIKNSTSMMVLGDLDNRVEADEFRMLGDLAEDINRISSTLNDYINEISHVLSHLSAGNMSVAFSKDIHYQGDFLPVKNALRKIKKSLNRSFLEIHQLSGEIDKMSGRVENDSSMIAQDAAKQAELIGKLTNTIYEIAEQTNENASDAGKAARNAEDIRKETETGRNYMDSMLNSIRKVSDSSRDISSIVDMLSGLARQTKLLALNAAIEAARAGEDGKGFSVVAAEVGALAAKSESAVRQTTELINNSISSARDSALIAGKTAESFSLIQTSIESFAGLCGDIAEASAEQAQKLELTSNLITNISEVAASNATYAKENCTEALNLSVMSSRLREVLSGYLLADQAGELKPYEDQEIALKPFIGRLTDRLKAAGTPEEMNDILEELIRSQKDMECLYVIGKDGRQITRTVMNPVIITEQDDNFKPAMPGDYHGDKKYFRQAMKYPEEMYSSYEYISTATGGLCKTLSFHCKGTGSEAFVICIDLICRFK
jgi:methyl-accepting chemotaxis protein